MKISSHIYEQELINFMTYEMKGVVRDTVCHKKILKYIRYV